MTDAQAVISKAKAILSPTCDAIKGHPFAAAVESGTASQTALHGFIGNQYQMWARNAGNTSVSMSRFADHPYRDVFLVPPEVEAGAASAFAALAERLGMDAAQLDRFEPSAQAFAYAAYRAWLVCYGSAAEIACARFLNLEAWGHNCGMLSRGLREHYGLSSEDTAFLDGFSGAPSAESRIANIIEDDLAAGVEPYKMVRAARMMQSYELMFWDAVAWL